MSGEEKVLTGKYFPKIRIDILTIVERVNLLSKNPALTLDDKLEINKQQFKKTINLTYKLSIYSD